MTLFISGTSMPAIDSICACRIRNYTWQGRGISETSIFGYLTLMSDLDFQGQTTFRINSPIILQGQSL